jgi:hypothetical protein
MCTVWAHDTIAVENVSQAKSLGCINVGIERNYAQHFGMLSDD